MNAEATDLALRGLAALLVATGVLGTFLPGLPGSPLVLGGLVLGAWVDDFVYVGPGTIAILVTLTLLTLAVELVAVALGTRRLGASRRAAVGAMLGALVGIFFGLPGLLLGPFVGAVLAELTQHGDLQRAGRAGVGAWLGVVLGGAAKVALVFSMIGVFAAAYLL